MHFFSHSVTGSMQSRLPAERIWIIKPIPHLKWGIMHFYNVKFQFIEHFTRSKMCVILRSKATKDPLNRSISVI